MIPAYTNSLLAAGKKAAEKLVVKPHHNQPKERSHEHSSTYRNKHQWKLPPAGPSESISLSFFLFNLKNAHQAFLLGGRIVLQYLCLMLKEHNSESNKEVLQLL